MRELFSFPRTREAGDDILAGLRAVRPEVDLLWWGLYGFAGQDPAGEQQTLYRPAWMLVLPGAGPLMRENAARALDRWAKAPIGKQHPQKVLLALLRYRGWRPHLAVPARDPDWSIVDDFAAWDWADRFGGRLLDHVGDDREDKELEERRTQMREAVRGTMQDIHAYVWKGRRSVLLQGRNN